MGSSRELRRAHVALAKLLSTLTGEPYLKARKRVKEAALGIQAGDRDVRTARVGGQGLEFRSDPEIF